ncbi:hypothetical protein Q0590_34060 [Rhodocytophaga aerolata]|uniref:Double-GTPase 2 domain-containing protein n=1 Tax=Rhodocytophaga aerolata TaxID=455078 RepID=A0ABT8RGY3_9BACT|nr:hypothetical protein [Rhodocytophaga aerolata]MDO1451350.1 hypothetical protein [Rhodocytophaga aerolata]
MPICNEEGCQVFTTGKCVNGLELDECPHYLEDSEVKDYKKPENNEEIPPRASPVNNVIDVYDGKALKLSDVNRIANNSITRLVILAGMPDAGKTTLLLSLMHIFTTNPQFGDFIFAGSDTLLDYELKSHPSKIDSENSNETTGRTQVGPPVFLHLKVADQKEDGKLTDLLFTDISGEDFRALRDSTIECKKFTIGQRADHFALFFDTLKITTLKERASAKASGIGILRSLIEAGSLLPQTRIQIIFSRWDLKPNQENEHIHDEFIKLLKSDISSQFGSEYEISFFEIAARPKNNNYPFGHGIENIFPLWVKCSLIDRINSGNKKSIIRPKIRQYLQFQYNF